MVKRGFSGNARGGLNQRHNILLPPRVRLNSSIGYGPTKLEVQWKWTQKIDYRHLGIGLSWVFFNGKSNSIKCIDYSWLMKRSSNFNLSFPQASTIDISNLQDLSFDVRLDSCFLGDIQIDLYNWNHVLETLIF